MIKHNAFTIIEIVLIFFAIAIVSAVVIPLNMSDASQAKRVAKWHKVYAELQYSFNLIKTQNGTIFGDNPENMTTGEYFDKVSPFLDIADDQPKSKLEKYRYKYRNKTYVKKSSKYYFDDFFMMKNNVIAAIKKNPERGNSTNLPYAYMFVDVNGFEKPNRVGLDIFFINIFNDKISAYGEGYPTSMLKEGCSKIGKGLFCSKYYLVGSNL